MIEAHSDNTRVLGAIFTHVVTTQTPSISPQVLLKATGFSKILMVSYAGDMYVFIVRDTDMFQGLTAKITIEFFFWICCWDELATPDENVRGCVEWEVG